MKLDLVPVMTGMGLATTNLGIGGTYSTTYHHPYHVARLFATVDHMTNGRSALNVVTSLNDAEAQNFGLLEHSDHDVRYDQAEEFMEIATALWGSWESDALILDSNSGQFADGDKVNAINYDGLWFKSRGPLTVPHCPQVKPVIIQAGQSPRGREFAAKWAELIFVIFPTLEANKKFYTDIKHKIISYGRDPQKVLVAPAIYVIVDDTAEAIKKPHIGGESLVEQHQRNSITKGLKNCLDDDLIIFCLFALGKCKLVKKPSNV